jgi:hypothetical protein
MFETRNPKREARNVNIDAIEYDYICGNSLKAVYKAVR